MLCEGYGILIPNNKAYVYYIGLKNWFSLEYKIKGSVLRINKCSIMNCNSHFSKNKTQVLIIHWLTYTNSLGLCVIFVYMYIVWLYFLKIL